MTTTLSGSTSKRPHPIMKVHHLNSSAPSHTQKVLPHSMSFLGSVLVSGTRDRRFLQTLLWPVFKPVQSQVDLQQQSIQGFRVWSHFPFLTGGRFQWTMCSQAPIHQCLFQAVFSGLFSQCSLASYFSSQMYSQSFIGASRIVLMSCASVKAAVLKPRRHTLP